MNTIITFPDGFSYDFKTLSEFIFNSYGSPDCLPDILDLAIKQITLSEDDNGTETVRLLFGLRDAFKSIKIVNG